MSKNNQKKRVGHQPRKLLVQLIRLIAESLLIWAIPSILIYVLTAGFGSRWPRAVTLSFVVSGLLLLAAPALSFAIYRRMRALQANVRSASTTTTASTNR